MTTSKVSFDFSGKKVFVTGSSRGLGKYVSCRFAEFGANVATNSRSTASIYDSKPNHLVMPLEHIPGDLTQEDQAKTCIESVYKKFGGLDILVCNIGSGKAKPNTFPTCPKEIIRLSEINFLSAVNTINSALPLLKDSQGVIVCISSICGHEYVSGAPLGYSVAKSALNMYVKCSSRNFAVDNIRINAVMPGNILFPGSTWESKLQESSSAVHEYLKDNVSMQRFGTLDEIANVVLFLASDSASFVTGSLWSVDGGQLHT